jgi:UDP-glucose 4-epimerase
MNVLLIGGNGFIGSHLLDGLVLRNHKVRVFDIAHEKFREPSPGVDYRISNLNNIPDLYEAMMGIDVVFHLASTTVPSTSSIDIIADVNNNVISTLNILNLAARQRIKKFVYFSSGGAIYGNSDSLPLSEDHHKNPVSSYGIIKETIEHYIKLYNAQNNLDYLILRPSNPYGPRQGHFIAQGVIATFLRKAKSNDPFLIYGNGSSKKDYIFIDDVVEMIMQLVESNSQGIFNIGSGSGASLNEIITLINKITKKENKVIYTESKSYDVNNFVLDISKLKSKLNKAIELTSLEKGIESTWDWIQKTNTI